MAFLLVVIVSGEVVSADNMLFSNIYRCNEFALAIEEGRIGPRNKRYKRAYRKYDLKKSTSMKVVSYQLDILDKPDDNFKNGEVWRLQNKEDSNGYVWRAKNKKGTFPEENWPSNKEDDARTFAEKVD